MCVWDGRVSSCEGERELHAALSTDCDAMFPPSLDSSSPAPSLSSERVCVRFQRTADSLRWNLQRNIRRLSKVLRVVDSFFAPAKRDFSWPATLPGCKHEPRCFRVCARRPRERRFGARQGGPAGAQQTTLFRSRVSCLVFVPVPTDTRPEPEMRRNRKGASEWKKEREREFGNSCGRLLRAANRLVHSKKKGPRAPQLKRTRAV